MKGSIWSCIHGDVPSWNAFMRVSSSTVLPHSIWQTTAGREQAQLQGNSVTRASGTVLPHSLWQTTAGREQAQLQGNSVTRASSTVLPHSIWQTTAGREQAHQQVQHLHVRQPPNISTPRRALCSKVRCSSAIFTCQIRPTF